MIDASYYAENSITSTRARALLRETVFTMSISPRCVLARVKGFSLSLKKPRRFSPIDLRAPRSLTLRASPAASKSPFQPAS